MRVSNRTKTVFTPPLPFPLRVSFSSPTGGLLDVCIHNSFDAVWSPPGGFLQTISAFSYMHDAHLRTLEAIYFAFRADGINVLLYLKEVAEGKGKEVQRVASALEEFISLLPFLEVGVHGRAWEEDNPEPCRSNLSLHYPGEFSRDFDAFMEKLCSLYYASRKVVHFLKSFTVQLPCVEGKGYREVRFEKEKIEGILLDILHPQECFPLRPCRVDWVELSVGYHSSALRLAAGSDHCVAMTFDVGCATPLRDFLATIYFYSVLKDSGVDMFEELARELGRSRLPHAGQRTHSVLKLGEIVDSAARLARNLNLL
ncbi:MAG: hypothetical protein QXJ59_04460 [Thermofilaceae archaeon]